MDITYVHFRGQPYYMITVSSTATSASSFPKSSSWSWRPTTSRLCVHQKTLEAFPQARLRFITDNGRQFVGKEFKEFVAMYGYTHMNTLHLLPSE